MFAIVEAGGRQEKVQPGAVVVVDRLEAEPGDEGDLRPGPARGNGGRRVSLARRTSPAPRSRASSLAQTKGKKIRVFKMKRRKHYRRTQGHRTQQTRVRVRR